MKTDLFQSFIGNPFLSPGDFPKQELNKGFLHYKQILYSLSHQGSLSSNLYAEYIMRYSGLEEAEAGIKIAGRNINNLRYADDTNLMAESEEELKSLLIKMKKTMKKLA